MMMETEKNTNHYCQNNMGRIVNNALCEHSSFTCLPNTLILDYVTTGGLSVSAKVEQKNVISTAWKDEFLCILIAIVRDWEILFRNSCLIQLLNKRAILFSGFRGEVENVSANQRPGRPSCFSDRPKNTNLVEDVEFLLPFFEFC